MVDYKPVPVRYRKSSAELLNVSLIDFATGRGLIDLFMGYAQDVNRLTNVSFYSSKVFESSGTIGDTTSTLQIDVDFDMDILRNMTIQGTGIFVVPLGMHSEDQSITATTFARVRVRHVTSAGAESEISTNDSKTLVLAMGTNQVRAQIFTVEIDIAKKVFRSGEKLRISVQIFSHRSAGAGGHEIVLMADPKGRLEHTTWDAINWAGGDQSLLDFTAIDPGTIVSIATAQIPIKMNQ